jgi:regulator of RNase E activity RraB
MEELGDPLTAKREIAHWAYFPDPGARDEFVLSTAKLGFALREKFEPDDVQSQFGACVVRNDLASWSEINEVTLELFDLATALGGDYDGWESPVEKV